MDNNTRDILEIHNNILLELVGQYDTRSTKIGLDKREKMNEQLINIKAWLDEVDDGEIIVE